MHLGVCSPTIVRLKTDLRSGQLYRLQVVAAGRVPRVDFTSVSFLHRPIGFGPALPFPMLHQTPARHSSWRSPRATTSFRMRSLVASIGAGYTKGARKSFKCRCKYTSGVRSASFLATPDNRSTQPPRFQMPPRSVLTHPFVFISLQTPFAATPLFSHPSKSPGGVRTLSAFMHSDLSDARRGR